MAEILKWSLFIITYMITIYRPRYGIGFVIFFLPLASRYIVFDEILISILVFMVIALSMGLIFRDSGNKNGLSIKEKKLANKDVIILFLISIMISFLGYVYKGLPTNVTILNNEVSNLLNYIAVMITAMGFYAILVKRTYSVKDWLFYIKVFLSGLLFLGVIYILSGPLHVNLPEFLQPTSVVDNVVNIRGVADMNSTARFAGYVSFYENFVEYLIIVITLAIILIIKRKSIFDLSLSISVIGTSLWFGLLSGTRSFPIMLLILLMLILFFQLRGGKKKQIIYSGLLFIIGLAITYFGLIFFSDSLLVTRFLSLGIENPSDVFGLLVADPVNNFFALINRPYMLIIGDQIIKTSGLIGVGPLTIHTLSGSDMVFHSSYYGIYVSLGLLGLISYLLLNIKIVISLNRTFENNKSEIMYSICLSLIITLLIDGIKVSFWRIPPTVFIYWFVFGLITSYIHLGKNGNWKY